MAVKRVNIHMSDDIHAALKRVADERGVRGYDVLEAVAEKLPEMDQKTVQRILTLPEASKKATIKVTPEIRDMFRKKADSYGVSMANYTIWAAATFYDFGDILARYNGAPKSAVSNVETPAKSAEKTQSKPAKKEESAIGDDGGPNTGAGFVNFGESRAPNQTAIDHYEKVGKRSLDMSNMTADEVRAVLAAGGQKAAILKQRMAAIKRDEEKAAKEREERIQRKISSDKSLDPIIAELKREAEKHRQENGIKEAPAAEKVKESPKKPVSNGEVREILVQDVDFDVECRQLSEIVDKLDKSIDVMSDLKRSGKNWASLNDSIKANNAAVFMVNRYITQRTRIHNRMEAERMAREEAEESKNAA